MIRKVIIAIVSILLLVIGVDKFLNFMSPPCTLMDKINPTLWKSLGIVQIIGAILIWLPKIHKPVVGFFILYMLFFTGMHMGGGTYDIGGAVFMTVLLVLLFVNPRFLSGRKKSIS